MQTHFAFTRSIRGVENEEAIESSFAAFQHVVYCQSKHWTSCSSSMHSPKDMTNYILTLHTTL